MKIKLWKIVIPAIIIFGFLKLYSLQEKYKPLAKSLDVSYPTVTNMYMDLFSENLKETLKPRLTFFPKFRSPIATIDLEENYKLIVFKLTKVDSTLSLKDLISNSDFSTHSNKSVAYDSSIPINNFNLYAANYKSPNVVDKIDLMISGNSFKTIIRNDTLLDLGLNLKKLGIGFQKNSPIDFLIEKKLKSFNDSHCEILFLKKKENIFVIVLFIKEKDNLPPYYGLYKILKRNES